MEEQQQVRSLKNCRVLVVDDHRNIRTTLRLTLEHEGAHIEEADSLHKGLVQCGALKKEGYSFPFDLVLLDIRLSDGNGLDLLRQLSSIQRAGRVIMISGEGTLSEAFQATQMGAFDFIEKPFTPERLLASVRKCLEFNDLRSANEKLTRQALRGQELLGEHPRLKEILQMVRRVGPTSGRVLIVGESGTGKELVARAIHRASTRQNKPLIKVNCAAIPKGLVESELFGHEKGAFTGAIKTRQGVFERAHGGTLFLDEIGELDLDIQAKLLRVLQSGEVVHVGGEKTIQTDVRLVAATNRNLQEAVEAGEFREDLFYRLNVVTITTPPLRERPTDIPLLAQAFLQEACEEHALGERRWGETALQQLSACPWPGNIRELKNVVERTAILSEDGIIESIDDLPTARDPRPIPEDSGGGEPWPAHILPWADFHDRMSRAYLKKVLQQTRGNVSEASRLLQLERAYLHRLMKRLGVHRDVVVSD